MNYVKELERVEERLKAFYNGQNHNYKKHQWGMERARHMEYQLLADRLLKIVGDGLGIRSNPLNPLIIEVGLDMFSTKNGLSSLHSSFLSYIIPISYNSFWARSLKYFVVDINEYYTSKLDYLHPVAANGSLPWKVNNGSSTTSSGSAASSSANAATST
ncbi:hypothetical protein BGZ47_011609 [Haplosporangium gracile]|nr:hypothetical protein BGZ47_011609 [Haplosporangium gracile]